MNAYLQRADDFIQQQIYKFEHNLPHNHIRHDEDMARHLQGEEDARHRGRASSHVSRPQPGNLGVPVQQRPLSTSPHPSPQGRLPPGSYLDTKTGQVVTNMFPPDHPMNAR
jgi:hypothetical protein